MVTSSAGKLIAAFVLLIIGIVLAAQVASIGQDVTTKDLKQNDSVAIPAAGYDAGGHVDIAYVYTVANAPTSWKIEDCPLTDIILKDSAGQLYDLTTDYIFTASAGTFTLFNTTETYLSRESANTTYATYTYCGDDYINLTWGRTGVNLVPGFFALTLLQGLNPGQVLKERQNVKESDYVSIEQAKR